MERRAVYYAVQQWRRERTLANESGHRLPPEIEEGGLVEGSMQDGVDVVFPHDPRTTECLDTRALWEAQPIQHHEQRSQMRRITDSGKK
jgi:hypothetical protein